MSQLLDGVGRAVGKRKQAQDVSRQAPPPTRDRLDVRADPAWVARVERQAERFGISVSAYIKQATTRQLELDEQTDPAK